MFHVVHKTWRLVWSHDQGRNMMTSSPWDAWESGQHNRTMIFGFKYWSHHLPIHLPFDHDIVCIILISIFMLILNLVLLMVLLLIIMSEIITLKSWMMMLISMMMWITNYWERMMSWWTIVRALITWIIWTNFKDSYGRSWSRWSSKLHLAWMYWRIIYSNTRSTCKILLRLLLILSTIITWILLKLSSLTHFTDRLCSCSSLNLILIMLWLILVELWCGVIDILLIILKLRNRIVLTAILLLLTRILSTQLCCLILKICLIDNSLLSVRNRSKLTLGNLLSFN